MRTLGNVDYKLETERLVLRVLDQTMAGSVLEYFKKNHDFLSKWEPTRPADFYTLQYQQELLDSELGKMEQDEMLRVWLFQKEESEQGRVIGSLAFNNIVRGCFHSCFLGYRLDEDQVNKGYMTEAIRAFVQFGFEQLELHRIEANILPRNKASLRVVEKAGFYFEGVAHKYLKINGQWEDHVHMVLRNQAME